MEQLNYKQIKKETKVNTACRSNPISEGLKASWNPVISEDLTFLTTHNLKGCGGNDTQFSVYITITDQNFANTYSAEISTRNRYE